MSNISVDYDVLNQRGSPAWFTDTFANIPTAGFVGRMFISKDTFAFYRDTGTGWDLIGGPGTGTITGSGAAGQVSYFNGASTLAGSNNLFWDNTNSRLGIGTITPGQSLDVHSTANVLIQLNNTTTANSNISFQNQDVAKWRVGNVYNAGANSFDIFNVNTSVTALSINNTNNESFLQGNVGIGVSANLVSSGPILTSTLTNGGTGYVDATYTDVAVTTISTTGLYALYTIVVSGGIVTTATLTWGGINYKVGDTITVSNTLLGGSGSGLIITVLTVDSSILTVSATNGGADITLHRNDATMTIDEPMGLIKWTNNDSSTKSSGINATIGAYGGGSFGGSYLTFSTRLTGSGNILTEAIRINSSQSVGIGVGTTSFTQFSLRVSKAVGFSSTSVGISSDGTIQSQVTSAARMIQSSPSTNAASFTLGDLQHFYASQGTIGSGSAVTRQYGVFIDATLIGATNNYAFYGNIPAQTNAWNIYINGTAANYISGQLTIGTTSLVTTAILSISSTTQGFLPPRMTTTQKNAIGTPATGLVVFDTTLGKLCVFSTTWQTITSV